MARGKRNEPKKIRLYDIEILVESNNADCVHHENIVVNKDYIQIGTCHKCGRVQKYNPAAPEARALVNEYRSSIVPVV